MSGSDATTAPGELDVAGSSKITDKADNVFTVWSARKEESQFDPDDEKPDASLELEKQRNGDKQRFRIWLYFDRKSMQFCTSSKRRPVPGVAFDGTPYTRQFATSQPGKSQ